jgi:hypothetical protein
VVILGGWAFLMSEVSLCTRSLGEGAYKAAALAVIKLSLCISRVCR